MERRDHPRIQIPLIVQLTHPSIGTVETTARDISEGGVFVQLNNPAVREGANLRVKLMSSTAVDPRPTPTVDMRVVRRTDDGIALAFKNRTAEHLWSSVERLREELQIGRDYFQVYQSILICHARKGILLVQRHGKWLFPGHYLVVADDSVLALERFAHAELGVELTSQPVPITTDSQPHIALPEAATFSITYEATTVTDRASLPSHSPFRDWRWLVKASDLADVTFSSDKLREIARDVLERLAAAA